VQKIAQQMPELYSLKTKRQCFSTAYVCAVCLSV